MKSANSLEFSPQSDYFFEGPSPITRSNPRFEKLRSTIKESLFKSENYPLQQTLNDQSQSNNKLSNHDMPVNNTNKAKINRNSSTSRINKRRDSAKGNFARSADNTSASGELSDSGEMNMIAPFPSSNENSREEFSKDEEAEIPQPLCQTITEAAEQTAMGDSSDSSVSKEENVYEDSRQFLKMGIFMLDTIKSEIEELKSELDIDETDKIYFIKGNFCAYYKEGKILGEGTTGLVKKFTKIETNEEFAVKIIQYRGDKELLTSVNNYWMILREFGNLKKLDHKNIIKVYELYVDYYKKKVYSVMELAADCREMFEVLEEMGHYSEAVASGIMKQILTGLNYLHSNGVCHRDIKPSNILVSNDGKIVKITDFNVSKFLDKEKEKKYSALSADNYKMWTYTGTIAFTAPEVFLDTEYTESVDVWSTGAVLYTMLCGYQPFQSNYVQELIEIIKEGKYTFYPEPWNRISDQAKDLIKNCLNVNSKTRYCPADALMHPWISNLGKVSDTKILFKDNLRVYYKNYKKDTKDYTHIMQMKKIQVASPNLTAASPLIRRQTKRPGSMKISWEDLERKLLPKVSRFSKESNTIGQEFQQFPLDPQENPENEFLIKPVELKEKTKALHQRLSRLARDNCKQDV